MKRRRILLVSLVVGIGALTLLIIVSQNPPASGVPLMVRFGGFTNDAAGNQAVVLAITNYSQGCIAYTVYAAQRRDLTGWSFDIAMPGLVTIHELPPGTSTNYVTRRGDFRYPLRFPVIFHDSPTRLETMVGRVKAAFHARSLEPFHQPVFPAFSFLLTNVVYSDELPAIELRGVSENDKSQE